MDHRRPKKEFLLTTGVIVHQQRTPLLAWNESPVTTPTCFSEDVLVFLFQ
jgi:hypothetical protein